MTITYQWIFDKVNFQLKKENKFFSSSELQNMIGTDAFRRIATDIGYPRTSFSSYMTSGQYMVSTPADFIKISETATVTYQHTSNTIAKLSPKEEYDIGTENVMLATPGTPTNYFMKSESQLGVYPPSTSGCLVIPYVKHPGVLSSSGGTNELTERCYMAAVYWTLQECFMADSDERAVAFEAKYNKEIMRLRDEYAQMLEITRDLKPHKDYCK